MIPKVSNQRALIATIAVSFWWALCWFGAKTYFDHQMDAAYRTESEAAERFVSKLVQDFDRVVSVRVGLPRLLARDPALRHVLNQVGSVAAGASLPLDARRRRWTKDPVLAAASRRLQTDADDLEMTAIALSDTAGNYIAASNAGTNTSFVGMNYRDRSYFSDLRAGRPGYHIAVGEQHGSVGIAFFAPIMDRGRVTGGVESRIDLAPSGNWLASNDAFLTDRNGVILLSTDPARQMRAVADAPVRQLDAATQQALYRRIDFGVLGVVSWGNPRFPDLLRVADRDVPVLWVRRAIVSGNEPVVHVLWPLPQLITLQKERTITVLIMGGMGTVLMLFFLVVSERRRERREHVAAVAQREREFRSIAENTPTPIVRYDRDCRRLYVNSAAALVSGKSVEALIGSAPTDGLVLDPDQVARLMDGIRRVFDSRESREITDTYVDLHGKHRDYRMRLEPESGEDGQVMTVLALTFEVTSVREAVRRTAQFLANFPGFVYTFRRSPDGRESIPFASPGIEKLYGLQPQDVRESAMPLYALVHPEDVVDMQVAVAESYRDMTPVQGEFRIRRPGLPDRWVEFRSSPVRQTDGGTVWHGIMLDISERRRYELGREAVLVEAERLATLRSEFLAHMSHELRTPLNCILGYAQILQRDRTLSARQVSALNVIQQGGEHLLALVDDILDLARIDANRLALVESDILLDKFLRNAVEIVAIKAREKGIAFSCELDADLPARIRGDERRLRQVLFNLLANAVKFTQRGGVCLRVSRVGPSRLKFAVEDTGIGIADAELEAIFAPFEQARGDVQKRFGGTGLGLAISRQLVRLMGGEILVQSRIDTGSVFYFELDVALEEMVPPPQHIALASEPIGALCVPPIEEMQVLHRLAQRGNMRDIIQHAECISGFDPRYETFTTRLRQLAESYQSKAILTYVEHYLHGKTA